jgi:DNA-binding transcriptional MerR regulator
MSAPFLSPSEAAAKLGVSPKALRLYEQRGLVAPARTAAGWRAYGPAEMGRAGEVVALRGLGLSLAQIGRVLAGDGEALAPALEAHEATLESRRRELAVAAERVRSLRDRLARGETPSASEVAYLTATSPAVAFDLPWPWGGERFELPELRAITWITGPLGCGKTKLALKLAEAIPAARFLPLERGPALASPPAALPWLLEDGATDTAALSALLAGLEAGEGPLVVDVVEEGLDEPTQAALAAWLRRRGPAARRLVLMTRSSAMLDLSAVGPDETLLLCPANHAPPIRVVPAPGAYGYEALASCLATPEVRARTAGAVVVRAPAA